MKTPVDEQQMPVNLSLYEISDVEYEDVIQSGELEDFTGHEHTETYTKERREGDEYVCLVYCWCGEMLHDYTEKA